MLVFRNRLRAYAADRTLHERTKQELGARTWSDVQHYADARSTVMQDILTRARAESP